MYEQHLAVHDFLFGGLGLGKRLNNSLKVKQVYTVYMYSSVSIHHHKIVQVHGGNDHICVRVYTLSSGDDSTCLRGSKWLETTSIHNLQGGPLLVINGVVGSLYMVENKWVTGFITFNYPTYRGPITPFITSLVALLKESSLL